MATKMPHEHGARRSADEEPARGREVSTMPAGSAEAAVRSAVGSGEALTATDLRTLQGAVGNQAVMRLIQARRSQAGVEDKAQVHRAARLGTGGPGGALPHREAIQRAFGHHDVSQIVAHTGAQATAGAHAMGAAAFAMGNHVAFAGPADLHTAAHEAAHVVQQRGGVQLAGGVGAVGDRYEAHADAVADRVVQGRSAEELLDGVGGETGARPGSTSGEPPVQRVLEWLWQPIVEGLANLVGLGGGQAAPPVAAPPVAAPPVVAPPVAAPPVAPTPAQLRPRLLAAAAEFTQAFRTLPAAITNGHDEPAMVDAQVNVVYAQIQHQVAFAGPVAAAAAEQATIQVEQRADQYRVYCAAVRASLEEACRLRAAYLAQLLPADANAFDAIRDHVRQHTQTAVQTQQACAAFIAGVHTSSARTSAGLYALMTSGGAGKAQAEQLVATYFAHGRLRLRSFRIGYASDFDAKTFAFGAEWTLRAPDAALATIAQEWVFHTHGMSDPAGNFTISRAMGASHIKRIVDAQALGVSLNFVDDAEFTRIENDADNLRAFAGWVRRDAGKSLRNTKKRN